MSKIHLSKITHQDLEASRQTLHIYLELGGYTDTQIGRKIESILAPKYFYALRELDIFLDDLLHARFICSFDELLPAYCVKSADEIAKLPIALVDEEEI